MRNILFSDTSYSEKMNSRVLPTGVEHITFRTPVGRSTRLYTTELQGDLWELVDYACHWLNNIFLNEISYLWRSIITKKCVKTIYLFYMLLVSAEDYLMLLKMAK